MNEQFYDVIVTGGGPAGTTCAIFLKKYNPGLRVCIIDKQSFPRKKTCGDGISPGVADIIADADIPDFFQGRFPINHFILSLGGAHEIRYDMRALSAHRSQGYVIERTVFDQKLFDHATRLGVHSFENVGIDDITDTQSGLTHVSGTCPGGRISLSGKIIVAADGALSMWRRHLHIDPNSNKHTGIGLRYYCRTTAIADASIRIDILENLKSSYGWFFPMSSSLANVGIGVDADLFSKRKLNLDEELRKYLRILRTKMVIEPMHTTRAGFTLPFASQMPPLVHGNKVLIGDAASMINPLTGEGIYYGMSAGKMLAEQLAASMGEAVQTAQCLSAFAREFEARFHDHYAFCCKVKKLLGSPLSRFFMDRLSRDRALMNKAVSMILYDGKAERKPDNAAFTIKHPPDNCYEQLEKNVPG